MRAGEKICWMLLGVFVGVVLMLVPYDGARKREIAMRRDLRAQQPRELTYESTSGDVWSGDFEKQVFRICQRVPSDLDATNLFLWARDMIVAFRKDERLLSEIEKPLVARKPIVTCMGEVTATPDVMRFAVMAIERRDGEDILDATLRWAKEMEARRAESGD